MFYIFVFLSFCSLTSSLPISGVESETTPFGCGISPALKRYNDILNPQNKIMGGVVSPPHFWPWLAALMYPKDGKKPGAACTGEIIGDRWIITAAHCQDIAENGFFNVGTNNDQRITAETRYDVNTTYNPPDGADIILVELTRDLKYSKDISPICISRSFVPEVGDLAVVAGFGTLFIEYDPHERTGVDEERTRYLHEALLTIQNDTFCAEKLHYDDVSEYICAGGINRGVMEGDSGGPIMGIKNKKFYLHGAVSGGRAFREGDDNLTVDELDLYTLIRTHCDWIEEITKGDVKCEN